MLVFHHGGQPSQPCSRVLELKAGRFTSYLIRAFHSSTTSLWPLSTGVFRAQQVTVVGIGVFGLKIVTVTANVPSSCQRVSTELILLILWWISSIAIGVGNQYRSISQEIAEFQLAKF